MIARAAAVLGIGAGLHQRDPLPGCTMEDLDAMGLLAINFARTPAMTLGPTGPATNELANFCC